ncbi:MAG: hypothetical protein SFV54_08955 [Bryobacteraceae bacterium]|nr:hypothetical protein [Bryobacteraceae bacterium]
MTLPASPQVLVDPATPRGRALISRFESVFSKPSPNTLECELKPLDPSLTFSFRFETGFYLKLPLYQLDPSGAQLVAVTSFRPAFGGGAPTYFYQTSRVPKFPTPVIHSSITGELGGGFYIGPGHYEVRWLLEDNRANHCSFRWTIRHRLSLRESKQPQPLASNTVTPLVVEGWSERKQEGRRFRVAILLHAAPLRWWSVALHPFDRSLLASALVAVLEKTAVQEASVSAFNLNQQLDLFHTRNLDRSEFLRLMGRLEELQLGTIGLNVLRNPKGAGTLLDGMLQRALNEPELPDAVVVIGPPTLIEDEPPARALRERAGSRLPYFAYFHLAPGSVQWRDGIEKFMKRVRGNVFHIRRAADLARAIGELEDRLARRREGR